MPRVGVAGRRSAAFAAFCAIYPCFAISLSREAGSRRAAPSRCVWANEG